MKTLLQYTELGSDGYAEDVFRLFPQSSQDSTVELALTHLHDPEHTDVTNLVLLHGQFGNRAQWYRRDQECVANLLLEQGYQVWLPEMRGHGLSPMNVAYRRNTVRDYGVEDLPAVQAFIATQSASPQIWFAQGLGGLAVLHGVASGALDPARIEALVLIGLEAPQTILREACPSFWSRLRSRRRGLVRCAAGETVTLDPEPLAVFSSEVPLDFEGLRRRCEGESFPALLLLDPTSSDPKSRLSAEILERWPGSRKRCVTMPGALRAGRPLSTEEVYPALRSSLLGWLKGLHLQVRAVAV